MISFGPVVVAARVHLQRGHDYDPIYDFRQPHLSLIYNFQLSMRHQLQPQFISHGYRYVSSYAHGYRHNHTYVADVLFSLERGLPFYYHSGSGRPS